MRTRRRFVGLLTLAVVALAGCGHSSHKDSASAVNPPATSTSRPSTSSTSRPKSTSTSITPGNNPGTSNTPGSSNPTTGTAQGLLPPVSYGNSKHCTIAATWKPRNAFGVATLHVQLTSDQPQQKLSWILREARKVNFIGGTGTTNAGGAFATDAGVGGKKNLTGAAVLFAILGGYSCSVNTTVP